MISVLALAMVAKAAGDVAAVKLITMGISSGISVYVATKPRAYQRQRASSKK